MAKKNKKQNDSEFVLYNVTYEDGTLSSNRKVPREAVSSLDADKEIRAIIEAQDREIAEKSGRSRGPVKKVARVPS
jgi:protein involved in ribonucleotide reduction